MIVGVDLDNTIVRYDAVFRDVALAAGFISPATGSSKHEVRELLRSQPGGEERWQWLQARVYGPHLGEAVPFEGFAAFAELCARLGVPLYVISHKTERAAADPLGVDLRAAARDWLRARFPSAPFAGIFFEDTRAGKLARIAELHCTHFVDDLAEVFLEPGFPEGVERWLFDPSRLQPPVPSAEHAASWAELSGRLERAHRMWRVASALASEPVDSIARVVGGGNNEIYRVRTPSGSFALKCYGVPDERARLEREAASLRFLHAAGVEEVPRVVALDRKSGAALFEWIEGRRPERPGAGEVSQALALVQRLHDLRREPGAAGLSEAAEAGIHPASVFSRIDERLQRLRGAAPELGAFLDEFEGEYVRRRRAVQRHRDVEAALAPQHRTLSPSDFGFHNALVREGRLIFLDFEYFGWDDPVKLVADFVLHPGMVLATADKKEWLAGAERVFVQDADFRARLA
ncbi:MAG TPA: aminoglycoside phosphotransferase family protein, partial [Verrucomicrobiae bacterium]|nr:aminoglycoside phosphotransferase family protein [Verrucomicrobiae bacterium]